MFAFLSELKIIYGFTFFQIRKNILMFCSINRKEWVFCENGQISEQIFNSINRNKKASKLFEKSWKIENTLKCVKMFFKIFNGKKSFR